MKLYHGSSTLPDNTLPSGGEHNGVFLSPTKEFCQIFGRRIHCFEIDESLILDLRSKKILKLIEDRELNSYLKMIELHETGLPQAFNHVVSIESLNAVKELALRLGFKGAYFFETPTAISIELWEPSLLSWVSAEENPKFDELND